MGWCACVMIPGLGFYFQLSVSSGMVEGWKSTQRINKITNQSCEQMQVPVGNPQLYGL